jgi:transposase
LFQQVLREVLMTVVSGLDLHRKQITFDVAGIGTGRVDRGRIAPAHRETLRRWLNGISCAGPADLAVEGCAGWRFVVEECRAAGVRVHLAEPADVAGLKGRRQHAKTDRLDARHLRELPAAGKLPRCWIPPELFWRRGPRSACTRNYSMKGRRVGLSLGSPVV